MSAQRHPQGRLGHMVAALSVIAFALGCLTVAIGLGAPAASAQNTPNEPQVEVPHIIPRPNSGQAPKSATDRGGWAQYTVFWGIIAAMVLMIALVVLESRRKLRSRTDASVQERTRTSNEPVAERCENRPDSIARQ